MSELFEPWPNYDKQGLEVHEEKIFVVHDPWTAHDIGFFYDLNEAEAYKKMVEKRWKKNQK